MFVVEKRRKRGVRGDDAVLVQERQLALDFEHALDDEHDVRTPGVVFVEDERRRVLQRPRQDAFAEGSDLLAVLDDDGVLANEIDAADVAVEVDADAGPVEPGRHLLDVGGLAGAVVALDHHSAVVGEAGKDRERGIRIEAIVVVDFGHMLCAPAERRHGEILVQAEGLPYIHGGVRQHVRGKGRVVDVHRVASAGQNAAL